MFADSSDTFPGLSARSVAQTIQGFIASQCDMLWRTHARRRPGHETRLPLLLLGVWGSCSA
jgi:hypothetical protein